MPVSHLYYATAKNKRNRETRPPLTFSLRKEKVTKRNENLTNKERKHLNKNKNKTEILTFRVTPEEKELIETKALSSYRLVSMYLRDCALDKEIIVIDGVKDVATELRRIGNNLNQITKAVNSGVYAVDLTETKKEVQKIWQSLNSLSQAVR